MENTPEEQEKEKDSIVKWKQILEDTPPNIDLNVASQVQLSYSVQRMNMDHSTVSHMNDFLQNNNLTPFVFDLYCFHHTIRAYAHGYFAVGIADDTRGSDFHNTIGMFFNTLLVPFCKSIGCEGETLGDLSERWIHDILYVATGTYDLLCELRYG